MNQNEYAAPRSSQFSLGIQQAIGGKSVLAVSYVGTRNRHQNYYTETNLPPKSLLPGFVSDGAAAQTYNASVPYVGYNSVLMAQNEANGDYNSIQVSLRGTALKNDLTFQVGYTYSHANDSFDGITRAPEIFTMCPTPTRAGDTTTGRLRSTSGVTSYQLCISHFVAQRQPARSTENDFGWMGDFWHRHGHFWCPAEYRIKRPKRRKYRSEYSQPSQRGRFNDESPYHPRVV